MPSVRNGRWRWRCLGWRTGGSPAFSGWAARTCASASTAWTAASWSDSLPKSSPKRTFGGWFGCGWKPESSTSRVGRNRERACCRGTCCLPCCAIYLDPFDEAVTGAGYPLIRYADDFLVLGRSQAQAQHGLERAGEALRALGLDIHDGKARVVTFVQGFEYLGAAIVGALRLPLHRVERPGRPPRFMYGYGPPVASKRERARWEPRSGELPLITTRRALRDRMVELLRQERAGRNLPPMAAALLRAWQEADLPSPPPAELEGWQSVYLI